MREKFCIKTYFLFILLLFFLISFLFPKQVSAQTCTSWMQTLSNTPSCSNVNFNIDCTGTGGYTGTQCCQATYGSSSYCQNQLTNDVRYAYEFRCCMNAPTPTPTATIVPTDTIAPTCVPQNQSCDNTTTCCSGNVCDGGYCKPKICYQDNTFCTGNCGNNCAYPYGEASTTYCINNGTAWGNTVYYCSASCVGCSATTPTPTSTSTPTPTSTSTPTPTSTSAPTPTPTPTSTPTQPPSLQCNTAYGTCGCTPGTGCRDGNVTDYSCCHRTCQGGNCVTVSGSGTNTCALNTQQCATSTNCAGACGPGKPPTYSISNCSGWSHGGYSDGTDAWNENVPFAGGSHVVTAGKNFSWFVNTSTGTQRGSGICYASVGASGCVDNSDCGNGYICQ